MTLPNRYHLWAALECHAFSKAEAVLKFSAEEDGMWVQWQDYARLKAEVERLRKAANNYIDVCDKYAMFRCDEERLMARAVALELMTAAKEGKDQP